MQSDENNLTNTTFLTSQKRKRSRQSKYEKIDYILGASNDLSYGIKKGRYIQYIKSNIHSLDDFMGKIQEGRDKNNLVYDILATIPYKEVGLSTKPSNNEINVICRNVVKSISEITGLNFVSSHINKQKNSDTLTSKIFKCSQDRKTRREDKNYLKPSYLKHFDCESKLKFGIKSGYNFITIKIQHTKHHPTQKTLPISQDLEDFIKQQACGLELGNVENSSNYKSELSEVSQSDDNYYEDSSEDEIEDPLYRLSKKLHYLSSILLENRNIRETFLSGIENTRAMTNILNRLDEILVVGRLYRNGTMDTCNTSTPPPGLAISYTDWIRYQKYDGEIIKNVRL